MSEPSTELPEVTKDSHVPRKIFHLFAGSIIPVLYYLTIMPDNVAVLLVVLVTVAWITFDTIRLNNEAVNAFFVRGFSKFIKVQELTGYSGSAFMLGGISICMLLFAKPVAIAAMFFISIGDPVAALVGKKFGRIRLKNGKCIEGSVAMFIVITLFGFYIAPEIPRMTVAFGALVATLVELFSEKLDDNLTVPIFAGATMSALLLAVDGHEL